jgi:hypothetical protein
MLFHNAVGDGSADFVAPRTAPMRTPAAMLLVLFVPKTLSSLVAAAPIPPPAPAPRIPPITPPMPIVLLWRPVVWAQAETSKPKPTANEIAR